MSAESDLALEHKRALADVGTLLDREVQVVKRAVFGDSPEAIFAALSDSVPMLSSDYGDMAAALASDYFDTAREIADVPGKFAATPADLPDLSDLEKLVDWSSAPLFFDSPDLDSAFERVGGSLQRVVTNVARETVVKNSARDPLSVGWKRIARSGSCQFCAMLSGAVYKDQRARFASHDRCGCTAAPTWDGGAEVSVLDYVASKRERTPDERAKLRAYLNKHHPRESTAKPRSE